MLDYHVHSNFSADSKMSTEEACGAAVRKGVRELAFTEHLDVIYPNSKLEWTFDVEAYSEKIDALTKQYEGKLGIIKGVEVGIHPSGYQHSRQFIQQGQFDFVIGSVHVVEDYDLHEGEFFRDKTADEAVEKYFLTLYRQVRDYPHFNVLGHLDLVKRYVKFLDCAAEDIKWSSYYDIVEELLKELIETGRGIEVNMSGYRYGLNCSLPDPPILRLYRDLGGEIITFGSDAHDEEKIAYRFEEAMHTLSQCGFRYITRFKQQQPLFEKIQL